MHTTLTFLSVRTEKLGDSITSREFTFAYESGSTISYALTSKELELAFEDQKALAAEKVANALLSKKTVEVTQANESIFLVNDGNKYKVKG